MIETTGEKIEIKFSEFQSAASYELFKKVKALPESSLVYDYETDVYTVSTHARYSNILGISEKKAAAPNLAFSEFLFEHQQEITRLAINAKRFAVWADCGLGKGQPYGSLILTPDGVKQIQNLKVGDLIIASDGKPYPVTGVYPKSIQPTYRIHFSDRTSFVVDEDHLHIVRTNNDRQKNKPWRVIETRQLIKSKLRYRLNGKSRNYDIPVVEPIEFENHKDLPIHPYLLGILLGDGCIKWQSAFSNIDSEIVDRVKDILGTDYKLKSKNNKDWTITYYKHAENPLTESLRDLGLFGTGSDSKFIPLSYLFSSVENRLELLRGLMDADGYIKDTCQFYTTSETLSLGVKFLIRSLGGIPTGRIKENPKYSYKGEIRTGQNCYVTTFSLKTFNPFYLSRKAKLWNPNPRDNGRWIDRIEFEGIQPTVCISVASPDSSYVTEDFIVTHNTLIEAEFARQANHITGGRSLILTLPEVALQTIDEVNKFHGKNLPICFLESKQDLRRYCEKGDNVYRLAITNYEKMNPEGEGELQIIREMKNLAALILDENRLKGGGGKQKWAIIKSSKGIPFKLTATATPAPNDYIEFASQASFLERMRNENEIIWTFFAKDKITGEWTVKRHAQEAFFEWMSAWSIYVRNPRNYGWSFDVTLPPEPEIIRHEIQITEQQANASLIFNIDTKGQASLFATQSQGVVGRSKMSQIAKGFVYNKDKSITRIKSRKPKFVADLIRQEWIQHQVLVWTVFDEESEILNEQLKRFGIDIHQILTGKTPHEKRAEILNDYRTGKLRVLISNSKLLGYGMNLQMTGSMIFSGWNDSFEEWYQTIRRAVRFGNLKRVRIHIPYIPELELAQLETIFKKETKFIEGIEAQERAYIKAMRRMKFL